MNLFRKYMDKTLHAIAILTRDNYSAKISVKRIRDIFGIKSSNYSKVNFYWRNLKRLEQIGILKCATDKSPKFYRVFNYFKFFELLHNSYLNKESLTEEFF